MSLRKSPARTAAFLAANRANAQRSTGPRGTEGKARVRLNGLRHGGRARALPYLLPGGLGFNDGRLYTFILRSLRENFQVRTPAHEAKVRRAAIQVWCEVRSLPSHSGINNLAGMFKCLEGFWRAIAAIRATCCSRKSSRNNGLENYGNCRESVCKPLDIKYLRRIPALVDLYQAFDNKHDVRSAFDDKKRILFLESVLEGATENKRDSGFARKNGPRSDDAGVRSG